MKKCKNCGYENYDINEYCSKCGTHFENIVNTSTNNTTQTNTVQKKNSNASKKGRIIAFVVVIVVILIVVISITTNNKVSTNSYSSGHKDYEAISAAKQALEEELNDPSATKYNKAEVEAKNSDQQFIVYLDVSEKNLLGGYVRHKYYVYIKFDSATSNKFHTTRWDATVFSLEEVKKHYNM